MRHTVAAALVWAVKNLPIDQLPIAGQADAAAADSPQGKANGAALVPFINKRHKKLLLAAFLPSALTAERNIFLL